MTTAMDDSVPDRERRLYEIIGAYYAGVEAGQTPDRRELLTRNPDLAASLAEFFAEQNRFHRATEPLREAAQESRSEDLAELSTIRSEGKARVGPGAGAGRDDSSRKQSLLRRRARDAGSTTSAIMNWFARSPAAAWESSSKRVQISLNRPVALKMILAGRLAAEDDLRLSRRGRGGRQSRPSEHRADLRSRRARRAELFQHEAAFRRQLVRSTRRRASRSSRGRAGC